MTPSRAVRVLSLFLLLAALPTLALAGTTEFRVFFDVDDDVTTGCTIGEFPGVEQVLVTHVSDDDSTPRVTRTHRQICVGGILGGATDVVTSGWPAAFRGGDRTLTLETRIPFSSFGTGVPESLHVGFDATRGAAVHAALANANGTPVTIPGGPVRRRALGPRQPRTIVMDGALADWGGVDPVLFGIPGGGSKALRILRILSFADPVDSHIYFAAQIHISSDAPFADEDEYLRTPGEELSVPAGAGVLKNDGDPNGLPLTATKVSEAVRGTVTLNPDGSFTYSPKNAASHLTDEFEYQATNGSSQSNVARVRIKVDLGEDPEGPPVDDHYEVDEDKTLTVGAPGVLANDPGNQNLVAALVTPPTRGTVTLNADGGFTYKPNLNFFGEDSFVYSATRTTSGKNIGNATVTIEVDRVNDAPSFDAGGNVTRPANAGPYSQIWATNISAGAPNENGQTLTFVVTNNNNALFSVQPSIAPNGTLSFTPTGALGSATVSVYLQDNGGIANGGDNTSPTVHFTITITCAGITVSNPAASTATVGTGFSQTFTQSGATGTATFTTTSTLPAGLTLAANGTLSGTPTQSGSFPISVTVTDSNGCTGTNPPYTLVVSCQTITVTNPATNTGTASSPFSQTFTQTGALGGATFTTASALPAGLTLAANGTLSGTPTQTGTFPIVVTVTDGNGCTGTGATYTLTIGCQTITVTNPANANATANSAFSETFTQTGAIGTAAFTIASGTLPAGLVLGANGNLAGTPTQTGSFPITVTVTDDNGCTGTSATYTIVVACQTLTVNNPGVNAGTAGAPFSQAFTSTNGIGTIAYTLASGTLPAGMALATNGTLSGTPTQTGTFPITVTATDANGCTGTSATYNLTINCQTITVTNPATSTGTVNAAFSQTFAQSGAIGTATFTTASTLPAGLTLATNGVLSGTPTQNGTFPIVVTVTDANGCTGTSATYTLVIACQTITVTNPANATGPAGSPFSETFTQTGAVGTATFTLASGTLPAGMTLAANGTLSGTPSQNGTFPITVTVTDANGCTGTSATYNLTITCQTITVTNPANANGTADSAFSETFTQTGALGTATFTLASGTLPAGLTLATNGVLSGTPTQTGSFPITVLVTDANGCTGTSGTYTIVIACQTITVTNPANANGTANDAFSETFTQTGAIGTPTFTLASGTLPAGLTLAANGTLSGTPTETGSFPITVTVTDANGCTGTSGTYTVLIACQTITVNNPANANGTANSAFSETFTETNGIGTITYTLASGTLPAGLALAANGTVSGTPTQTGSFPITVTATDANGCTGTSGTYTIVIGCQTITVSNPASSSGTAGSAFSETFTQTGAIGTVSFSVVSGTLPAGLTLDSSTGVLSGTPTQTGNFSIVVRATDVNGCFDDGLTYPLVIGCQTISVTNPSNATGPAGSPFSETFTQTGAIGTATFTLASGTLPAGLTLAANGVLSGTPTQGGSFPITVTVTDGNGCTGTSGTYTIVITCPTITVTNPANANGTANSAFSETFTQTGGQGTITWSLATGTLPAGLTLAPNGTLSGTPTQTGSFPITVTATDANGCTGDSSTYTINIACQTITVNNPANGNGTANSAFSETFTNTGAIGTTTYSLASGTLPAGLTLAANGTLSGTPTQTGSFPITVTATDANGCTGTSGTYTIVIGCQTITVTNPSNVNGTINAPFSETFTQTGAIGTAVFTTGSTLPAGLTLGTNGVLSGTPTETGTFPIVVTVTDANACTGNSATYNLVIACQTITVTNPSNENGTVGSPFSETFTQSGVLGTPTWSTSSTLPAGITLDPGTGVLSGTPMEAGNFPITVTVTDSSNSCTGTSSTYTLVIACQTITVNNPANADGTVGSAFSETFTQTGGIGTVTYSTSSTLPAGITLDSSTGVLSGTPTEDGSFPIVVVATDSNGCTGTSATYNLNIVCQVITVNNPANAAGVVDAAFSETFTNTGAIGAVTYTLASGTLPSGLTLAANGVLSGTPGEPGSFPITVTVTDANGCTGTSATYTLVIACQTITVTNPAVTAATVGSAFSQTFTQTGVGTHTPAVWSLASGTLPNGLTLNTSTGVLSGTPTQTGTFPITVTVTDANSCAGTGPTYNLTVAPVAVADSFSNAVSNTQYVLTGGTTATPSTPAIQIAGTIEVNDLPSAATVTVTAETKATTNGGSVTIAADGTFLYTPPAQPTVPASATDTFTYTVSSDTGGTGTPVTSAPGTVTVNLANRVWYVNNDSAPGGDGRSQAPFDTLAEAQAASTVNDHIFVYAGNGTNSGQNSGFIMKAGQRLYGQGIALVVNSQTLVAAGSQPLIGNSGGAGVTFTNLSSGEIKGLNITGSSDGIVASTNVGGTIEISNNTIRGSGGQGVNIDGSAGTFNVSIHDNTVRGSVNGIDINRTGGTLNITAFDDLVIDPATGGVGTAVNAAVFDSDAGTAGFQQVDGNNLVIGIPGDGAGTGGMSLTSVQGNLFFDDLDIVATNGTALFVSGTGGGMTFAVTPANPAGVGTSTIDADNGPAVDIQTVALDLRLAQLASNTAAGAVNLATVTGQFRAPTGSAIAKGSGGGTAFAISNSNVVSDYEGTLTVTSGGGVSLTNNAGSTISFEGGVNLTTGANAAFSATGGGTVTVLDPAGVANNTISTTTGNAVTITTPTNIGAGGVTFQSITVNNGASNSAVNAIVLSGTTGPFTVTGDGSQTGGFYDRDGSGGTLNRTTGHSVLLSNASNVTLRQMNITNSGLDSVNSTTGGNITLSAVDLNTPGNHGWLATNIGGANAFNHNSRAFNWQALNSNGVQVSNATDSGFTSFTVDKTLFSTSATGADGFLFDGNGDTAGTVTVTNSEFTLIDQDAVQVNNDGSGVLNAIVQSSNFHDADSTSGDGNNTLFMAASNSGTLNFTIGGAGALGNTFTNLGRLGCACGVVQVNAASSSITGTRIVGIVQGNTISNTTGRRGIDFAMEPNGGAHGGHDITVIGNNVSNTQNQGINVTMTSLGGGDQVGNKIEIANNILTSVGLAGSVDSGSGIEIETNDGAGGATFGVDILIQGNQVQNNNASAVGSTLEIVNRGVNAGSSSTMNVTVWGNTLTNNTVGSGEVFEVLSSGAAGTVNTCLDLNGANVPANANSYSGGAGGFRITNNYVGGGSFNIGGMTAGAQSAANVQTFVSARNNSLTVTAGGAVGTFAGSPGGCTLP